MPNDQLPRDYRLCYHTRSLDFLLSALQDGFWPRYCPEDYSRLFGVFGEQFWFAAPMVCFTDMLPDTNESHRGRYGDYTVAISKDSAAEFDINPLIYVMVDSFVAQQIAKGLRPGGRGRIDPNTANPLRALLPYIKVTPGAQLWRGGAGTRPSWEVIPMEDEMEWRYVPNDPGLPLVEGVRESKDVPAALMALTQNHRLKVPDDNITDIIVPTRADAKAVIARFPHLKAKVVVRKKGFLAWVSRWF